MTQPVHFPIKPLHMETWNHRIPLTDIYTRIRHFTYYLSQCLTAAGPKLWNSLPAGLTQMDIGYEQFKRLLNFVWALRLRYIATIRLNCTSPNFLIYLLTVQQL